MLVFYMFLITILLVKWFREAVKSKLADILCSLSLHQVRERMFLHMIQR